MYTHTYMYIYIYIYIYTHLYIRLCMYAYIHTYIGNSLARSCAELFDCSGRETKSPFADSFEEPLPLLKTALTSCPESCQSGCLRQFLMVDLSTNSGTSMLLLTEVQAGPANVERSGMRQAKPEVQNAKFSLGPKFRTPECPSRTRTPEGPEP